MKSSHTSSPRRTIASTLRLRCVASLSATSRAAFEPHSCQNNSHEEDDEGSAHSSSHHNNSGDLEM